MLYDKDIRDPLFDYLEEQFGKIRVIDEKQLGSNTRADMFMVTESEFIGIEIKSDADTYIRLASQIKGYDAYCDRNYIVAGSRHGKHVAEHVPSYWGIIRVPDKDRTCVNKNHNLAPQPLGHRHHKNMK